ncbi:hypothetical protein Tco_0983937 [Tanacetum coccineum]
MASQTDTVVSAEGVRGGPGYNLKKRPSILDLRTPVPGEVLEAGGVSGCGTTIVDERIFPTVAVWRTSAPKDGMPPADSYSSVDVTTLNTRQTPIQKQPKVLLCLVGLSRNYFLGDDVYPTFLYDDYRDLFKLISAPNPLKVKTGVRPRAAHEVPLLTVTASRVIEIEETGVASESSGTPSALEKSPLDFIDEDPPQTIAKRVRTEG